MSEKKIFVGNLPFSTTSEDLQALFSKFGDIQGINIRKDRRTNRSRGFAFITFGSEVSASEAVQNANHVEFQGRRLTVNAAEARGSKFEDDIHGQNQDSSWKTVPSSRKKNYDTEKKNNGNRSWSQWATPTAQMVKNNNAPKIVPLLPPKSS